MFKGMWITGIVLPFLLITTLWAKPLSTEYLTPAKPLLFTSQFLYVNDQLWGYLRLGLTYLESPEPTSPPEDIPPAYMHPDARGFGTYGLSPEAYEDVRRLYPDFKDYSWQDMLSSHQLYELANRAFADLLLRNLQEYIPNNATQEEIFDIIHKAWNLGLTGFKSGRETVESRDKRAEEFKIAWGNNH